MDAARICPLWAWKQDGLVVWWCSRWENYCILALKTWCRLFPSPCGCNFRGLSRKMVKYWSTLSTFSSVKKVFQEGTNGWGTAWQFLTLARKPLSVAGNMRLQQEDNHALCRLSRVKFSTTPWGEGTDGKMVKSNRWNGNIWEDLEELGEVCFSQSFLVLWPDRRQELTFINTSKYLAFETTF